MAHQHFSHKANSRFAVADYPNPNDSTNRLNTDLQPNLKQLICPAELEINTLCKTK